MGSSGPVESARSQESVDHPAERQDDCGEEVRRDSPPNKMRTLCPGGTGPGVGVAGACRAGGGVDGGGRCRFGGGASEGAGGSEPHLRPLPLPPALPPLAPAFPPLGLEPLPPSGFDFSAAMRDSHSTLR